MKSLMGRTFFSDIIACLQQAAENTVSAPEYAQAFAQIIASISEDKSEIFSLPISACEAGGGSPSKAVSVAAAWVALRVGARLFDDVEDGDVGAANYGECTPPCVINLATGFYGITNLILLDAHDSFTSELKAALIRRFNRMIMKMVEAQHLELTPGGILTLDDYWRNIQGKSGVFFGVGVQCGAMCGTRAEDVLERYYKFGYNLGIALQLIDDFRGFFFEDAHSDLAKGKRTALFFFIEDFAPVSVKEQIRLLLNHAPEQLEARERLRQIAREQGAAAYVLAEIARYRHRAVQSLLPDDDPEHHLIEYLEQFVPLQDNHLANSVANHSISSISDH